MLSNNYLLFVQLHKVVMFAIIHNLLVSLFAMLIASLFIEQCSQENFHATELTTCSTSNQHLTYSQSTAFFNTKCLPLSERQKDNPVYLQAIQHFLWISLNQYVVRHLVFSTCSSTCIKSHPHLKKCWGV